MSQFTHVQKPNERQYATDSTSFYVADATVRTPQNSQSAIFMTAYPTQHFASYEDYYAAESLASMSRQLSSNPAGQDISLAANDRHSGQNIPHTLGVDSAPSFALSGMALHVPSLPKFYSPVSSEPYPRISHLNNPSLFTQSQKPDSSLTYTLEENKFLHLHETNQTLPFGNSPYPRSGLPYPNSAHSPSWRRRSESDACNSSRETSPSVYFPQSESPQSFYSDLSEERPRQRRRVALSAPVTSSSSEPGSGSEASLKTVSSSQRKTTNPMKARASRKLRSKQTQSISSSNVSNASSAFSTFSINLGSAEHEPSGATYMATVDFRTGAGHQDVEHGPTDLPPRPYVGGPEASSPWKPRKDLGTIPGSALDYLPVVENRMERLERALDRYLQYRGELAVQNSILPGLDSDVYGDTDGFSL